MKFVSRKILHIYDRVLFFVENLRRCATQIKNYRHTSKYNETITHHNHNIIHA